jgi:hypothetical protein
VAGSLHRSRALRLSNTPAAVRLAVIQISTMSRRPQPSRVDETRLDMHDFAFGSGNLTRLLPWAGLVDAAA